MSALSYASTELSKTLLKLFVITVFINFVTYFDTHKIMAYKDYKEIEKQSIAEFKKDVIKAIYPKKNNRKV